ncbi:MAG: phosphate ABC transporter substrate-binding protein [Phycisphaerae bacterium]|jgi:phosphate transport system substrate-binding protein|nr:phosphate ABC transporter substrate-binding protein [Phycisphaerae bacterium]
MLKRTGIWTMVLIAVFVSTTCFGAEDQRITIAGSSTVRPIVQKASEAFRKANPTVKFVIGGGGSSHGVKSAGTSKVQLGMASRNLKDKETKQYKDLVPVKVGLDGIAVIINAKNPITKITKKQVQDIYTGKITNWKDVGGADAPISLISKEEGRSTLELFLKYFGLEGKEIAQGKRKVMVHRVKPPKGSKDSDDGYSKATSTLIGPNRQAIGYISTKPNAIAYVSVGTAQEIAAKGGRVKLLDLDGVKATVANVASETYPLRRPLNVITKGQASGDLKKFIDFMLSDAGQKIVEGLEFVPLKKADTPAKKAVAKVASKN